MRILPGLRRRPLTAALVAVVLFSCAGCSVPRGASAPPPSAPVVSAGNGEPAIWGTDIVLSPVMGRAYSGFVGVICGVPVAPGFGKRLWTPVMPLPRYPGPGTAATGAMVAGTMTLVAAQRMRFTAGKNVTRAPYTVFFEPSASPRQAGHC